MTPIWRRDEEGGGKSNGSRMSGNGGQKAKILRFNTGTNDREREKREMLTISGGWDVSGALIIQINEQKNLNIKLINWS